MIRTLLIAAVLYLGTPASVSQTAIGTPRERIAELATLVRFASSDLFEKKSSFSEGFGVQYYLGDKRYTVHFDGYLARVKVWWRYRSNKDSQENELMADSQGSGFVDYWTNFKIAHDPKGAWGRVSEHYDPEVQMRYEQILADLRAIATKRTAGAD